jgi:hypothetical protein
MILEFTGPSYLTSTIGGNIRWAAAELFEEPEHEETVVTVSLSTECDIYSFGSITLQVSGSGFKRKFQAHFAYAPGIDLQGTLLQREGG